MAKHTIYILIAIIIILVYACYRAKKETFAVLGLDEDQNTASYPNTALDQIKNVEKYNHSYVTNLFTDVPFKPVATDLSNEFSVYQEHL